MEKLKVRLGPGHKKTITAMKNLAEAYESIGQWDRAVPLCELVTEYNSTTLGPDHPVTIQCLMHLARYSQEAGMFDRAEPALRRLIELRRKQPGPMSGETASLIGALGLSLVKQGRPEEAEPVLRECLAIRDRTAPDDWQRFSTMSVLGEALLGRRDFAAAEPLLRRGYDEMLRRKAKIPPAKKRRLTEASARIAHFYELTNQPEQARLWREQHPADPPGGPDKP